MSSLIDTPTKRSGGGMILLVKNEAKLWNIV